ncbi:MAG: peptidyl-prolyl cis-trans isomerase [Kiritimatiellae bacterium]|nr:peptidyl-prolyl cis-trans isomerase [Kiritimatiellia bacterium]
MVIHHFNRLIRNKWIWGAFAVAISAFFAFDFLFTGGSPKEQRTDGAGSLGEEPVSNNEFHALKQEIRRSAGRQGRDISEAETNRAAWEAIAAYRTAQDLGLTATDEEVAEAVRREFTINGQFNFNTYKELLAQHLNLTPEGYEAQKRRDISIAKLNLAIAADGGFVSQVALDRALQDATDKFTVRVIAYTNTTADAVSVTDDDLKAYYEAHTNLLALADCATVRYIRVPADGAERLATFEIAEDDVQQYYEDNISDYETATTNGVVTKAIEDVRDEIVKALQLERSVDAYEQDFAARSAEAVGTGAKFLDDLAKELGEEVKTSPLFALDGSYKQHSTSRVSSFAPGAKGFAEAAGELDEENRWTVVSAPKAVYVVEYDTVVPAHVPSFEEAKDAIRSDALKEKQAKTFKETVEKSLEPAKSAFAQGKAFDEALFADAASVSTQQVFSVTQLMGSEKPFPEVMDVYRTAMKLPKGAVSEFIALPNPKRGLVVYMEERESNALDAAMTLASTRAAMVRGEGSETVRNWSTWNLARMNLKTNSGASINEVEEVADEED